MKNVAIGLGVFLGLTIGNFIYQILGPGNFGNAIERSWFQAIAISVMILIMHLEENA